MFEVSSVPRPPKGRATCTRPDCGKPVNARGLCSRHYKQWRLYGDPDANMRNDRDPADRFWECVDVGHPAGCWWWTARINNNGYGTFRLGRRSLGESRTVMAHRFAYENLVALIPEWLQLDHLCRNRACVNPDHVQIVDAAENTRRSMSARKMYCKNGHKYTRGNTYINPKTGRRSCRTCRAASVGKTRKAA